MTINDVREFIESSQEFKAPEVGTLFDMILRIYEQHRIENTSTESDGDMLLFQWGTYNWGDGRYFNIDLTRQVMETLEDPDEQADSMQQLSVALKFIPSLETDILRAGDKWCHSPSELQIFKEFVSKNEAFIWAGGREPDKTEVLLTYV